MEPLEKAPGMESLREELRRLGCGPLRRVSRVRGGRHTLLLKLECEPGNYCLRVFPPGQDGLARREWLIMRGLQGSTVPVPQPYAVLSLQGRSAILMAWCSGRTLLDELRRRPWLVCKLGSMMGRVQARLHSVPVPPELLAEVPFWLEEPWLDAELRTRLGAFSDGPQALLHLDIHPLNVMTDGRRVTCLLDWANARLGDPRADYARTLSILRLETEGLRPLELVMLRLFELGWRWGYASARGKPKHMAPFLAWAGELMLRDRGPRPGREDPMSPEGLARVQRWVATWRHRSAHGR